MNRHFVFKRFLPSLIGLLIGAVASGATLSHYRGNAFDAILVGAVLYATGFVVASLLIAAIVWAVGCATLGALRREQFQGIWVAVAALIQFLLAALTTYDLFRLGVFGNFLSTPDVLPRLLLLAFPYLMTVVSLATIFNTESEAARTERLATLRRVESELGGEKLRSRAAAALPVAICVLLGGVIGWVFPLEADAAAITAALGACVGIPLGMAVHRYLPSQRKLRELEQAAKSLRW